MLIYDKAGIVAKVEVAVNAPINKVWDSLINPKMIRQYMLGATVISNWKEGSPIAWKGNYKGKPYEDKGVILKLQPLTKLQYTHFSPLSGQADIPENYHTVTIELKSTEKETIIALEQSNNESKQAKEESEKNWKMMLENLKKMLEK
jgi:uncharacterized protein YndB with AHSA1/START domain